MTNIFIQAPLHPVKPIHLGFEGEERGCEQTGGPHPTLCFLDPQKTTLSGQEAPGWQEGPLCLMECHEGCPCKPTGHEVFSLFPFYRKGRSRLLFTNGWRWPRGSSLAWELQEKHWDQQHLRGSLCQQLMRSGGRGQAPGAVGGAFPAGLSTTTYLVFLCKSNYERLENLHRLQNNPLRLFRILKKTYEEK